MTDTATELDLTVSKFIAASREKLFDAWLDPNMLSKFMTPGTTVTVSEASSDAKVGGRFRVVMVQDGNEMPHAGTYKTIDRPNRLSFTWESPFSTVEDSTVTIEFAEKDGGTDVTLHHVRFENEELRNNHQGGWTAILDALAAVA